MHSAKSCWRFCEPRLVYFGLCQRRREQTMQHVSSPSSSTKSSCRRLETISEYSSSSTSLKSDCASLICRQQQAPLTCCHSMCHRYFSLTSAVHSVLDAVEEMKLKAIRWICACLPHTSLVSPTLTSRWRDRKLLCIPELAQRACQFLIWQHQAHRERSGLRETSSHAWVSPSQERVRSTTGSLESGNW